MRFESAPATRLAIIGMSEILAGLFVVFAPIQVASIPWGTFDANNLYPSSGAVMVDWIELGVPVSTCVVWQPERMSEDMGGKLSVTHLPPFSLSLSLSSK